MDKRVLHLLFILCLIMGVKADFTSNCPQGCKCVWASGNKQANCSQSNLQNIPRTLSTDIQNLDLSYNPLYEISSNAFDDVQLINLKKLHLRDCKLETIHRYGFSGLAIMIELDLSKNSLKTLHPDTFKETSKIRWIILKDNQLEKLEDGLFSNLQFLQKVELSNNRIVQIGVKTFFNVPKLNTLELDGNKLEYVKVDTLNSLTLSNLNVHDNPWRCDCYLQPFRNWVISKHLYTSPISCHEPAKVQGKTWKDLDTGDFACRPTIVYPSNSTTIRSSDNNITLSCQVNGNPLPEVNWVLNAQIIDKSYRYQGELKYDIVSSSSDNSKWVNLTIMDAGTTDNGEYLCVAKNQGGVEERSITLVVTHVSPDVIPPTGMDSNMLPLLIGTSATAAVLLIILIILCYCCCRRRVSEKKKADVSNGEALIEGSVIPEMEKSLMNAVNPVTKPPRRYDAPPSITSGTEMSELNKTLLDNDFVYAHNDDEKRSLGFEHITKRSHDALDVEYERTNGRAYPPDLLSFPPRAAQISPAASNASTVPDTTRLPPQINPVSPIHSPIYGMTTNQNLFRTLPYSRSQSPFTAPITPPVVTPRQGYVTIPRRPRVPSWSSTASTQILPSAEAQEPLYDNLGLRTTADGSSVLSLNKTGLEVQFSPMRNRPLPATPTSYQPPHPAYCAPIEELEPSPSPVPAHYGTNVRNSMSSQLSSTPGPQEPMSPRMSWTTKNTSTPQPDSKKALFNYPDNKSMDSQSQVSDISTLSRKGNKPETGSLRRNPKTENEEIKSPSKDDTRKNESGVSLNQSGTLGRSGKIPPRPPPKPKKKLSTEVNPNETLLEDEGEDGTEV